MNKVRLTSGFVSEASARSHRTFLFLQGPISPFFARIADGLEARGHRTLRVNLCFGDTLFWRRRGALNYRGTLDAWPDYVAGLMDRETVTDIVLLGEQRDYHRAAVASARARGIAVTVTDFGYLRPDWITLERDGMSGDSRFPRDPGAITELALGAPAVDLSPRYRDSFWTMALWDMAYHLSSSFLWMVYPHYRSFLVRHPVLIYLGIGLRLLRKPVSRSRADRLIRTLRSSSTPYFVFPLQMEGDFQIRAYSPFSDLKAPARDIIRSFARAAPEDAHLVIKNHPLDPGLVNWRRVAMEAAAEAGVTGRVHYIDGGSLKQVLETSRGVVTINSTVGMWALLAGRPLIVLGQAVYDVPGLTFGDSLDRFWTEGTPPDPNLRDAFVRALAATTQIRGVYYRRPGLDEAVEAATERLDRGLLDLHGRLSPAGPAGRAEAGGLSG